MRFFKLTLSYELHYQGANFVPWAKDNIVENQRLKES